MCCCGQPNVNGTPGYRWQPYDAPSTRRINPPDLAEGDTILADEPGRCGGIDSHSHHFRLVKSDGHGLYLLVRHGAGDERIKLTAYGKPGLDETLADMEGMPGRYWLLHSLYALHRDTKNAATEDNDTKWKQAAADKRIKVRKNRGRDSVKVWIEPPATKAPEA